ncbi:DUF952 domain-containing protein [Candidatus Uabimicrobium sp. HlEnr_7]|uniref:DUF952 domain-containing protein n=1 Tax=Candidatus Uabimicrobium helgolandensis TaxID=3095367 RepID=UPI003557E2B1
MEKYLYHITSKDEWSQVKETYLPQGFSEEGFIHCSYLQQIVGSANKFFQGKKNLVILQIERQKLECKVVDENLEGGEVLFPHVYDSLPVNVVVKVIDFNCQQDGNFYLPSELNKGSKSI